MARKLAQIATLLAALAAASSVSAAVQAVTKETNSLLSPITGTGFQSTGIIGSASLEQAVQSTTATEACRNATPVTLPESNGSILSASIPLTPHPSNDRGSSENQTTGCCLIYYQGQWFCIPC